MKRIITISFLSTLFIALFTFGQSYAQSNMSEEFHGAKATKSHYNAIYQLDVNNKAVMGRTLRNIENVLNDPRLKGKLTIELIAYAGGTNIYFKGNEFGKKLKELKEKGVILAQCNNTLHERHISKSKLYPFVSIVPSGNGELIIREAEGWSVVKP
ncbi:MAG TPA: DsrE family protein [Balneolales bacterium]|nr:DsrE family protein [Balneolales bacterium]